MDRADDFKLVGQSIGTHALVLLAQTQEIA